MVYWYSTNGYQMQQKAAKDRTRPLKIAQGCKRLQKANKAAKASKGCKRTVPSFVRGAFVAQGENPPKTPFVILE